MSEQPVIRRIDGEYGIWRPVDHPITIEYRLAALEEIRAAVAEAFRAVPRGGLETGGLLLGQHEGNLLQITGQQPLPCEHAFGPGFVLSPRDEEGLAELLSKAEAPVVGWYHSHTRSDISLTPQDLEIHGRYFPEPWQVALVLKPLQQGPARAAFFFPSSGKSGDEILVQPYRSPRPRPVPRTEPRLPVVPAPPRPEPVRAQPEPARVEAETPHASTRWAWLAVALTVVFAALGVAARQYVRPPEAPPPMLLRALDNNGQLEVSWDRAAKPVQEAVRGVVEIDDGGQASSVPLDSAHLRSGSLTYARRSGRVDVRLRLFGVTGRRLEEVTSFLGQPLPAPADEQQAARDRDEALQERDQALKEAETLKAALKTQMARNSQLGEAVRVLRQRLNIQAARRRR